MSDRLPLLDATLPLNNSVTLYMALMLKISHRGGAEGRAVIRWMWFYSRGKTDDVSSSLEALETEAPYCK